MLAIAVVGAVACETPVAPRPPQTSLFGCWAHTSIARDNELSLCTDGAFVRSAVVYPNSHIGSPPTICSSRGTVAARGRSSFQIELDAGSCENGRSFAESTLRCFRRPARDDRGEELHCMVEGGDVAVFRPTRTPRAAPDPVSDDPVSDPEGGSQQATGPPPSLRASVHSYGRIFGEMGRLLRAHDRVFRDFPPAPTGIEATTAIPCEIGEQFGAYFAVRYVRRDEALGGLTIRWEHPLLDDPESQVTGTATEYPAPIPPALPLGAGFTTYAGWALDSPADLVGGRWRAVLLHRGRELAAQEFTVGCPDVAPGD